MSKGLRISLLTIGGIVAVAVLLLVGVTIGRAVVFWPGTLWTGAASPQTVWASPYAGSMRGPQIFGPDVRSYGMMGSGFGDYGMMGTGTMRSSYGGCGIMGFGMMGLSGSDSRIGIEPLDINTVQSVVDSYLEALEDANLEIGEIMIFENHAYVQVVERDTGIGALELLVDPVTLVAYPEHGPAMMWNLKYSPMSGSGGFGMMGMIGGFSTYSESSMIDMMEEEIESAESPVSPAEAVEIAQRNLDTFLPGTEAGDPPDKFYGYYTLHIERGGKIVGMLSVNGTTGMVWLHTWHGDLIETSDHE